MGNKNRRRGRNKAQRNRTALKRSVYGGANWPLLKQHFDLGRTPFDPVFHARSPNTVCTASLLEVQDRIRILRQSDFRQFIQTFNRMMIPDKTYKMFLHFSGQQFFFSRQIEGGEQERSVVFESKALALLHLRLKKVAWVPITTEI